MTPRESILLAINLYLKDNLISEGFSFSESQLLFKRKLKNGFSQQIKFTANLRNYAEGMIKYGEQYNVVSTFYKKWTKDNFPNSIPTEYLECNYSAFKGMNENLRIGNHYEFWNSDSKQIMEIIWSNYLNHGKLFFEDNNSWEKLSKLIPSNQKTDSLILADKLKEAKQEAEYNITEFIKHYGSYDEMDEQGKGIVNSEKERIEYIEKRL